jgi:hypothetical protein
VNRGNRTFGPRRVPVVDPYQLPSAVAGFAGPDAYASRGVLPPTTPATVLVVWFQVFRRL